MGRSERTDGASAVGPLRIVAGLAAGALLLAVGLALVLRETGAAGDEPAPPSSARAAAGAAAAASEVVLPAPLEQVETGAAPAAPAPLVADPPQPPSPAAGQAEVSAARAWDDAFSALDALAYGTADQDLVLGVALGLAAQLDPDAEPSVGTDGSLRFALLDDPERGKVTLRLAPPGSSRAQGPLAPAELTIQAQLVTRPGAYTGDAADRSTATGMTFSLGVDEQGISGFSMLAQNYVPGSPEAWARMSGRDRPSPIGGVFSVRPDGASWRQLRVAATLETGLDGQPTQGFRYTMADSVARWGTLGDARAQRLAERYESLWRRHATTRPR